MILGYYPKRGSLLFKLFQLELINTLNFDLKKVKHHKHSLTTSSTLNHHPTPKLGQVQLHLREKKPYKAFPCLLEEAEHEEQLKNVSVQSSSSCGVFNKI